MEQKKRNNTGQFFAIVFFGVIFAVLLGFGAGWFKHDHRVTVELSPSISFAGTIGEKDLDLSRHEVESLNRCLEKWRNFTDVLINLELKGNPDQLTPDTRFDYNVNIRTASDINIYMRPRQIDRRELIAGIVGRVNDAGKELGDLSKNPVKSPGIKNIHL